MLSKEEYLNNVSKEVSFTAARKYLRRELETHIDDKKQELAAAGVANAEELAVASMGEAKRQGRR